MKSINLLSKIISLVLSLVLIAAMAILISSCGNQETEVPQISSSVTAASDTSSNSKYLDNYGDKAQNIGKIDTAKYQFIFKATDNENNSQIYRVFSDKTNIGEALSDLGLIKGDKGQYGLFVTEVNGKKALDNHAWMLYINGEQAMTGVDGVTFAEKTEYEFRLETFK